MKENILESIGNLGFISLDTAKQILTNLYKLNDNSELSEHDQDYYIKVFTNILESKHN